MRAWPTIALLLCSVWFAHGQSCTSQVGQVVYLSRWGTSCIFWPNNPSHTIFGFAGDPTKVLVGDLIMVNQQIYKVISRAGEDQIGISLPDGARGNYCPNIPVKTAVLLCSVTPPPKPPPSPTPTPIPGLVGTHAGSFSVAASGSAHYSIPIEIPAGAKLEPSMSLEYDSSQGNSILGMGWALRGLRRIHRCASDMFHDGTIQGIKWDTNGKFCLDGEPLYKTAQAGIAPSSTVFKTYQETFEKIESLPQSWIVRTISGMTLTFGSTTNSRVPCKGDGKGAIMAWALDQVEDIYGNYYRVTYDTPENGNLYPTQIQYSGNKVANVEPAARISFSYTSRDDVDRHYLAGEYLELKKTLSSIKLETNRDATWSLFSEYLLKYQPVDLVQGISRLQSVTRCGIQTTAGIPRCLEPTTFSWPSVPSSLLGSGTALDLKTGTSSSYDKIVLTGDFNRDGVSDIFRPKDKNSWILINTLTGGSVEVTPPQGATNLKDRPFLSGDFNGDGCTDILVFASSHTLNFFFSDCNFGFKFASLSNAAYDFKHAVGSGSSARHYVYEVADFNGDGRTDLLHLKGSKSSSRRYTMWLSNCDGYTAKLTRSVESTIKKDLGIEVSTHFYSSFVFDANGDGLDDWVWVRSGPQVIWYYATLNGGFEKPQVTDMSSELEEIPDSSSARKYYSTGDFNGDGNTDFLYLAKSKQNSKLVAYTFLSSGGIQPKLYKLDSPFVERFYPPATITDYSGTGSKLPRREMFSTDLNLDGRTDLVHIFENPSGKSVMYLWFSKGDGTFVIQQGPTPSQINCGSTKCTSFSNDDYNWLLGNFDASGSADLIYIYEKTDRRKATLVRSNLLPSLNYITKINEGKAMSYSMTYSNLLDSKVYTRAPLPLASSLLDSISPSFYVVSQSSEPDGIGGEYITRYAYKAGLFHKLGLNFMGFGAQVTTDQAANSISTVQFHQDPSSYLIGAVKERTTTTTTGAVISRVTSTYTIDNQASTDPNPNHKNYYHYESETVSQKFDLDTPSKLLSTTKRTIVAQRKDFGLPASEITRVVDDFGTYTASSNVDYEAFLPQKWFFGVAKRTTKKICNNADCVTKTQAQASNNGVLQQTINEPDQPSLKTVTTLKHDAFGNIIESIVSADGLPTTSGSFTFDPTGRFLLTTKNALGHVTQQAYHPQLEKVLVVTDANGLSTKYDFDPVGRLLVTMLPTGVRSTSDVLFCDSSCATNAVYVQRQFDSFGSIKTSQIDRLGRPVRVSVNSPLDGTLSFVDTLYNTKRQAWKKSLPYVNPGPILWQEETYDVFGRLRISKMPDTTTMKVDFQPYTTINTNQNGKSTTMVHNSQGQLLKVQDPNGAQVTHTYSPWGSVSVSQDPMGTTVKRIYDVGGRLVSVSDLSRGTIVYEYNALDQMVSSRYPSGKTLTYAYDAIGRQTRIGDSSNYRANFTYDTCPNGIGKECSTQDTQGFSSSTSYSSLGLTESTTINVGAERFSKAFLYDSQGRVARSIYRPQGAPELCIQNSYKVNLLNVISICGGPAIWSLDQLTPSGSPQLVTLGSAQRKLEYDLLERIKSILTTADQQILLDLKVGLDPVGNVLSVIDGVAQSTQAYVYDNINQLVQSTWQRAALSKIITYHYDAAGNIKTKSDVGDYLYDPARPNSVAAILNTDMKFEYDLDGNMVSDGTQSISFNHRNMPERIQNLNRPATNTSMLYSPTGQKLVTTQNGLIRQSKTISLGDWELVVVTSPAPSTTHRFYLNDAVVIEFDLATSSQSIKYYHRDHLGSVVTQTVNGVPQVDSIRVYAPFGTIKNRSSYEDKPPSLSVPRGFTGHNELAEVALVHTGARLYNPKIGIFLSPDAVIVGDATVTISMNPYIYALNNPTSRVDPDGHNSFGRFLSRTWKFVTKVTGLRAVSHLLKRSALARQITRVAISLAAFSVGGPAASVAAGAAYDAYMVRLAGGTEGDMLKFAAIGAAQSTVTAGVGEMFGSTNLAQLAPAMQFTLKTTVQGAVGGGFSVLQGGKFKIGFASAALAEIGATSASSLDSQMGRLAVAGISGGAGSKIAGGKFADGAIIGVIVGSFNHESHAGSNDPHINDPDGQLQKFSEMENSYAVPAIRHMVGFRWRFYGIFHSGFILYVNGEVYGSIGYSTSGYFISKGNFEWQEGSNAADGWKMFPEGPYPAQYPTQRQYFWRGPRQNNWATLTGQQLYQGFLDTKSQWVGSQYHYRCHHCQGWMNDVCSAVNGE